MIICICTTPMTSEITCSNEWTSIQLIICLVCHSRRKVRKIHFDQTPSLFQYQGWKWRDCNAETINESHNVKWPNMFFIHLNVINLHFHYFSWWNQTKGSILSFSLDNNKHGNNISFFPFFYLVCIPSFYFPPLHQKKPGGHHKSK